MEKQEYSALKYHTICIAESQDFPINYPDIRKTESDRSARFGYVGLGLS